MSSVAQHIRKNIFSGMLALIPIILSALAIQFIYVFIDQKVLDIIDHYLGFRVPGLGILLVVVTLYLIGLISSHFIGARLFGLLETITHRIPIINTTYQVGRQVAETLSLPEKQVFKKAVLVNLGQAWVIGFVTGALTDAKGKEKLLKTFIPSTPNPTTGFVIVVKESNTLDPNWSIDEGMRAVISGGIIGPDMIVPK